VRFEPVRKNCAKVQKEMLLVTLEGLPRCIGPDILKSVSALLSGSFGAVILPPLPPIARACADDPVETSLANLLSMMRSIRRAKNRDISIVLCQHWIDPSVLDLSFSHFRVALAAALAAAMEVVVEEHVLIHIRKSPHMCFEMLSATCSTTDKDFPPSYPVATVATATLSGILAADSYLNAAAHGMFPVTPFPQHHEYVVAPPFVDDNPSEALSLARKIVTLIETCHLRHAV
jgi:hypothetical protein